MFNPLPSKEVSLGLPLALGWQLIFLFSLLAAFWLIEGKKLPHPVLVALVGSLVVTGTTAWIDNLWTLVGVGFSEYVLRVFGVGALTFLNAALVSVHAYRSRTTQADCTARTAESDDDLNCRPSSPATVLATVALPIVLNLVNWASELQA